MNESPVKPVIPDVSAAVSGGTFSSGQLAFWSDSTGTLGGVPGGWDEALGSVAIGIGNTASGLYATVGGGISGSATGTYATVGGGQSNTASNSYATIGGGQSNTASNDAATIGGGRGNSAGGTAATVGGGISGSATGTYATVGGGALNAAGGAIATVAGGQTNIATGFAATIGGGAHNTVSGSYATVGGGLSGSATGLYATVGGGDSNTASGPGATIGGGGYDGSNTSGNVALGAASTIGGGLSNTVNVNGTYATVGGGRSNSVSGSYATIGGGQGNTASDSWTTVGGGQNNAASNTYAAVGGGVGNTVNGVYATVGGGGGNKASNSWATVGGGQNNAASNTYATIGGGYNNTVSGSYGTVGGGANNIASGFEATVPGGANNQALGARSFAAGSLAISMSGHNGAMIFSDDAFVASGGFTFNSAAPDEFAVRATGGFRFVTGIDTSGNVTNLAAISTSGNLGLRTGSPAYALDLQTPGSASSQMHITPTGADSGGYLTSANPGNLFMSAGAAWNGSAWVAKSSSAYQYGGGVAGVRFFFDTGLTVGSTYTPTTRMFIGPTGHVGIGMSTAPAHLLQLGLDDAAKPSTSTWTIASDGRLKDPESIEPFTEGSEFIRRLPQPVWFRYRKESGLPSDRRVAGWVAQDVASVAPFMVRRTKQKLTVNDAQETDTLSLNTNELPYAMLNSIKELLDTQESLIGDRERMRKQVEQQAKKLRKLEEELSSLRNSLREQTPHN
jgi:hypothetical protein